MKPPRQPSFHSLLLRMLLLASMVSWAAATAPFGATEDAATELLVATVRSVDLETTTLDLITGCGHCLHTVRLTVTPETQIRVEGKRAAIALSHLKPGVIVRAQFLKGRDKNLATTIEVKAEEGKP
jgi:hypothetical protein